MEDKQNRDKVGIFKKGETQGIGIFKKGETWEGHALQIINKN